MFSGTDPSKPPRKLPDPDRPIIIGMVPNVDTMPAWGLPANKTQSGMMSRSTPGGGTTNANALRFEDKRGAEQVWLKAERNFDSDVGNDQSLTRSRTPLPLACSPRWAARYLSGP